MLLRNLEKSPPLRFTLGFFTELLLLLLVCVFAFSSRLCCCCCCCDELLLPLNDDLLVFVLLLALVLAELAVCCRSRSIASTSGHGCLTLASAGSVMLDGRCLPVELKGRRCRTRMISLYSRYHTMTIRFLNVPA